MIKRKMSAWDNLRFGKGLVEECLKKALNMEEEQEASGATNTASQEPVKGCEVCREEPKCGKAKHKEGVCVNLEGSLFATKPSTAHLDKQDTICTVQVDTQFAHAMGGILASEVFSADVRSLIVSW